MEAGRDIASPILDALKLKNLVQKGAAKVKLICAAASNRKDFRLDQILSLWLEEKLARAILQEIKMRLKVSVILCRCLRYAITSKGKYENTTIRPFTFQGHINSGLGIGSIFEKHIFNILPTYTAAG